MDKKLSKPTLIEDKIYPKGTCIKVEENIDIKKISTDILTEYKDVFEALAK